MEVILQDRKEARARYQTLLRLFFNFRIRGLLFAHFLLQDCTGAHYQTARRGSGFEFSGLLPIFVTTRLHGGKPPWWWLLLFYPPVDNPIIFDIIIMHLLHSCIQCDSDNSRSILHKSGDGFSPFFRDYQTVRGHITRLHSCAGLRIFGPLPTFLLPDCTEQPPRL